MSTEFSSDLRREEQLNELIAAYLDQVEAGRSPEPDEWLDRHLEFKAELSRFFADRQRVERLAAPLRAIAQPFARVNSLGELGDFRLVREIGRGGMGVVYEAEQISLKRRVALKVLPFTAVLDPRQLMRFKHEAQAAAMLKHPNIVSVHAVGCDRGVHYYAMELVDGWGLDRVGKEQEDASEESGDRVEGSGISVSDTAPIAALSTLVTGNPRERFRQIARLGIQAAEALHYAHEMGIVHRDIKPSNLLVDAHGHLWITDFGLATTQTDAGLTMTGDLLGTLRYMSPEQAVGDRPRIDYRTDIYSLGITLYELLAGQPAFQDTDRKVLFRRIIEDEPKPLRTVDAAIPRDLETIVLKSIDKEPQARYDSAAEFAADLDRFCEDKPIRARRTSRAERLWRWGKRNRLVAALSLIVATFVTMVAVTAPMIAWHQSRLVEETRLQLYAKDLSLAYNAWNEGRLGQARQLLDRYASGSPLAHFRDFSWYLLDGLYQRATAGFMSGTWFDISQEAKLAAVAKSDDSIHLYDLASWGEVGTLEYEEPQLTALKLSRDGRFLAASYHNGTLSVWDVQTRKRRYTITVDSQGGEVYGAAFSPDGSMFATGGADQDVKVWESTTGKPLQRLHGHRDDVSALTFSPDGKTLATASYDNSLRLWDTDTWKSRVIREGVFNSRVFALVYDPTGSRLASGGHGDEVILWNNSGERLASLPTSGSSLCFSKDGKLLAVGGGLRGTVHVWDIENQKLIQEYRVGGGGASVAFLSRGELLIGANEMLMRRHIAQPVEEVADGKTQVGSEDCAIDISRTGDLLVAGYGRYLADPGEGAAICRDLRSSTSRLLPELDGSSVFGVVIDPTGKFIAAGGGPRYGPGFVKFWDTRAQMFAGELPKQQNCVTSLTFSPHGDRLAIVAYGQVSVWEHFPRQPKPVWPSRDLPGAFRASYSPAGDVLAVGCFVTEGNQLVVLDAESGDLLDTVSRDRAIMDVAFSPDGRLLTSIDWQGVVEIYDRYLQRVILSELVHEPIGYSVAFSPDGRTLATASNNGEINLWHVPTMTPVTTLKVRNTVSELKYFPDGQTLAVGYNDRSVELWHLDRDIETFPIGADAE